MSSRPPVFRHVFLAFTNPIEDRESDFNAWYDSFHVPELLRWGKGFVAGRRFRLVAADGSNRLPPWQYVALYLLDIEDPAALTETWIVDDAPRMTPFAGLLKHDHAGWVYTPTSSRIPGFAAPFLRLDWSLAPLTDALPSSAQAFPYELNTAQRGNQPASPWPGLAIEELESPDAAPSSPFDARWTYTAVGPLRRRDTLPA